MTDNSIPLKRCKDCGIEFPKSPEYFHFKKTKGKHYAASYCIPCENARVLASAKARVVGRPAYSGESRECSDCKNVYPLTNEHFYKNRQATGQLAYRCKSCARQKNSENYEVYGEQIRTCVNDKRLSDLDSYNAHQRERYHANPLAKEKSRKQAQKYRRSNREALNLRFAQLRKENPAMFRAISARRRARKLALPATFTSADWIRCLEYFNNTCAVCQRPPGLWHTLAQDHWIALADPRPDNPGTVPWNIVPLCHGDDGCNNSKRNHPAEEWLKTQFYSAKQQKIILDRVRLYFAHVQALEEEN